MAQIPTSSITMAAIATEVGVSTSSISMANLRANSISYTAGSGGNTNAAPDMMRDWAGYLHSTPIGITSYGVRFNQASSGVWPTGGWGLSQTSTTPAPDAQGPDQSEADGGIYLFTIDVGGVTLLKADLIANVGPLDGDDPGHGKYYTTGGPAGGTTFGSYTTNGLSNSAITIVTFAEAGVAVTATRNAILDSHEGKDAPTGLGSGMTYVTNTSAGAPFVDCEGPGCSAEEDAVWRLGLTATKSGFTATAVNGGLTGGELTIYGSHNAYSDSQE